MKYNNNNSSKKTKVKTYPSSFGSHVSMLNPEHEDFNESTKHNMVICEDSHGSYATVRSILDSGFSDQNRNDPIDRREVKLKEALNN